MTIIEAIKSGKAFMLADKQGWFYGWYIYNPETDCCYFEHSMNKAMFDAHDILADDWEVREE